VKAGIAPATISPHGLDSFLAYGSVIFPFTIWDNISSLLPGHYMIVKGNGELARNESYWSWSDVAVKQDINQLLAQSTKRHMVSDVPIAFFLSGGYDSTAIATMASLQSDVPINSFTVAFPEREDMSEANLARKIADKLGAQHTEISITLDNAREELDNFFDAMDQPSDDGLNVKLISKAVASAGFKVAVHGVGGDELFGGYPSFRDIPNLSMLSKVPFLIRKLLSKVITPDTIAKSKISELLNTDFSLLDAYLIRRRIFSYKQRKQFLGNSSATGLSAVPDEFVGMLERQIHEQHELFSKISCMELYLYAANKLLVDGDVMSMSHGLEVRFPLLDVDLIASALNMDSLSKKPRRTISKPALVKAVPSFPVNLMSRKKRGFTLPIQVWLRSNLKDRFESIKTTLSEDLGFDKNAIDVTWMRFEQSSGGYEWLRVWQLFALGSWYQTHCRRH
jgi:asparagine synthase (glutamine-hydrolysing)